jgi:DNA polymerase-4
VATAGSSRRILHCDMDCFYAAVHMRDDPSLRGLPVVIGGSPEGRGVVAAASYEARRFGIRSATPAARAVRLCPQAVFIEPDFPRYRRESDRVFEIFRGFTDVVQPVSIDEAYLDVSDCLERWGSATAVAEAIRQRVRDERGLTVSIGVAPNRLVAKIASDRDKPDGLTVVTPSRLQEFLDPLPVRSLPGVGPATERRLHRLAVETVAELRAVPLDRLERRFGRHGATLYRYARGRDERPVRTHRERKSLSAERTYARDLTALEEMDEELGRLAERVGRGLAKRGLGACTLTLKVRYGDFTTVNRSQTLVAPTADAAEIGAVARRLLRRSEAGRRPVRLLGVGGSKLVRGGIAQLALFAPAPPSG